MTKEDDDAIFASAFGAREAQPDTGAAKDTQPAEQQEQPQEQATEAKPETPAAEQPAETPPTEQAEAQPAPQTPAKPPIDPEQFKGYLDEKFKRREAEQERDRLRAEIQAFQQQQRQPEKTPDVIDDPDGFNRHLAAQLDQRVTTLKLQQSEFMATKDYGAELVGKVKEWAMRLDDARANALVGQISPFHAAVEEYKKEQAAEALKKYDFDLEKMKADWLKEMQAQAGQTPPVQSPSNPQAPVQALPPKVAGAGGAVPQPPSMTDDDLFRTVFTRKTGT